MSADRPFVIRDPIHGYVHVAAHERLIVDDPVTQRLRNIAQNGLAHMVYPEARTSRFVHSLGAMHLASRFLLACVEHSEEAVAAEFFEQIRKQVEGMKVAPEAFDFLLSAEDKGGTTLLAAEASFRTANPQDQIARRRLLAFAEAGLRLAALYHDLGHLPFSHDLEFALIEFTAGRDDLTELAKFLSVAPHEEIGHRLARMVLKERPEHAHGEAIEAIYRLASAILENPPLPAGGQNALTWLHSLVDGEIDVDRADYLLRDGRAFGFEFAAFDLERLIDNLIIVRDGPKFVTAVREQGISSAETFFLSRARSYHWLARHHKIAQIGCALRYVSRVAFGSEEARPLLDALTQLAAWAPEAEGNQARSLLKAFSELDDAWWLGVLRALDKKGTEDPMLRACIDLVLGRKPTLISLWKRSLAPGQIEKLNPRVDRFAADPSSSEKTKQLMHELQQQGYLIALHRFVPYRSGHPSDPDGAVAEEKALLELKSLVLVQDAGRVRPLAEASHLVHSLLQAWRSEPHAHVFKLAVPEGNIDRVKEVKEFLARWTDG